MGPLLFFTYTCVMVCLLYCTSQERGGLSRYVSLSSLTLSPRVRGARGARPPAPRGAQARARRRDVDLYVIHFNILIYACVTNPLYNSPLS